MKHPKIRVQVEAEPCVGSFVINGSYQLLNGDTLTSGEEVHALFAKGLFRYQFLQNLDNPTRRSRICRCSRPGESEWLAGQVDKGSPIVVAPLG